MTFTRDPAFGNDPWIGPGKPVSVEKLDLSLPVYEGAPQYSGADTLGGDIHLLPSGLNAYMSYVDNYGGWGELVSRFGNSGAWLGSITIFGGAAVIADVESGAMSSGSFPGWYDTHALKDPQGNKWGYTNAGNMQSLINAAGGRHFIRWSAHTGFGPHICGPGTCGYPQADWTQWRFNPNGVNIDLSVGNYLPHAGPPPPPPDPNHYKWFYLVEIGGRQYDEAGYARQYDIYRAQQKWYYHPHKKELDALRVTLKFLADEVYRRANKELDNGKPSWNWYHRGWRYQALINRSKGELIAS